MPENYTGGLNFTWPIKKDTGWDDEVDEALDLISSHDHSGGGNGAPVVLASNAVDGAAFRLDNNQALRALSLLGDDVNLFKLNTEDVLEFLSELKFTGQITGNIDHPQGLMLNSSTETAVASGALSLTTTLSILNGSSLSMSVASGSEGQIKDVVNINASNAIVTPTTTAGANAVTLLQYGSCRYIYESGEWRVIPGRGCFIIDDVQATVATSGTYTVTGRNFTFSNGSATTATFNNGVAGQRVSVANLGAGTVTLTLTGRPSGSDVATIVEGGSCDLFSLGGIWYAHAGGGCTLG